MSPGFARTGASLIAATLIACVPHPEDETPRPSVLVEPSPPARPNDPAVESSRLTHVSVYASVDAHGALCVSDHGGRVHCAYAHEDWVWHQVPGLDGARGVVFLGLGQVCGVSQTHDAECTTVGAPHIRRRMASNVARLVSRRPQCALGRDGSLTCWGSDHFGTYLDHSSSGWLFRGAPTDTDGLVPPTILALGVDDVALSSMHLCRLAGSQLTCEGANGYGQTTDAPANALGVRTVALDGVTAVSAGSLVTCALSHGEVWCWGDIGPEDSARECIFDLAYALPGHRRPDPTRVLPASSGSPYVALEVGREQSCVETLDGELSCWAMRDPVGTLARVGESVAEFDVMGMSFCFVRHDGSLVCDGEAFDPPPP